VRPVFELSRQIPSGGRQVTIDMKPPGSARAPVRL
jgi:hypothetical protein